MTHFASEANENVEIELNAERFSAVSNRSLEFRVGIGAKLAISALFGIEAVGSPKMAQSDGQF